ncbi:hypothetical protein PHLGIDRAFT_216146 [Phlebiopsis gigantea 11061_1 CR5-6]|uniref:Uncharacterized protein n=1 Tax=Phlebiopsis gigantea (strain 11061_1 CR5-6) TaxID=745531 RepID=A0A0C3PEP6_PHLG1|nr:hypothetical protein PHLGIDRAFT_216146 [Phlebiopsis gigantea 11061_1 CR5-6]
MYASKTIIALAVAAAAAPAFGNPLAAPVYARDTQDLQSGAFNFGSFLKSVGSVLGLKREEVEMLARDVHRKPAPTTVASTVASTAPRSTAARSTVTSRASSTPRASSSRASRPRQTSPAPSASATC